MKLMWWCLFCISHTYATFSKSNTVFLWLLAWQKLITPGPNSGDKNELWVWRWCVRINLPPTISLCTGRSHASHTRRGVLVALLQIFTECLEACISFNAAMLTMRLGLGSIQQRLLLCTRQLIKVAYSKCEGVENSLALVFYCSTMCVTIALSCIHWFL